MTCIQLNEVMPKADKLQDSYHPPPPLEDRKEFYYITIAMLLCYELEAFTM